MATWTPKALQQLGGAGEIRIAGARADGSIRPLVIIWGVRVGDDYVVRSVRGRDAAWFRGTQLRHEGRVTARGASWDVTFEDVAADDPIQDAADAAYRDKYGAGSSAVNAITSAAARAATLKVLPR